MSLRASFSKQVFKFNFNARTSRGLMPDKTSWFICIWDQKQPEVVGMGECGPLPGLSVDDIPNLDHVIANTAGQISTIEESAFEGDFVDRVVAPNYPALRFAVETAVLDFKHGGVRKIFDNGFYTGTPIPINGLIWMAEEDDMIRQIDSKLADGFTCIKLKVGGLDFGRECEVIRYIRSRYSEEGITIRLDANGAFGDNAMARLQQLAEFDIHSIEQPVPPGHHHMAKICRLSPIPVALDEELIGKESTAEKVELLARLQPQYIILKPTLHGGFSGCTEWIKVAESLGIGWWITSALESNIGLNAICQFTAGYNVSVPQGLGTGQLYHNNVPSPLVIKGGNIIWDHRGKWDVSSVR